MVRVNMNYELLMDTNYDNLDLDGRIMWKALKDYNGRDYGSLVNAIKYHNILDDEAYEKYASLERTFINLISQKEELDD